MADALGNLQAAYNLTKDLLNLRDAVATQRTVFELQSQILAAQNEAFAANQAQAAQVNEIGALKEEVARLKAWGAEKEHYQMHRADPGVIFYVLKPEYAGTEPFHQLCANCFDRGQESKLQATQRLEMRYRIHYCPLCKSEFAFGHVEPPKPTNVRRDFDPFTGR